MTYDDGESFAANDVKQLVHANRFLEFVARVILIRRLQGAERRAAVVALLDDIYDGPIVSI